MPAAGATRWGWHQLADGWARRLVAAAGIEEHDLVLDIGAGTGAITRHLVDAGARVLAVELHPGRASALRAAFAGEAVKVLQVDAADLWLPSRPFRVVANPPFAVTAALLGRLAGRRSGLVRADLVVPRHVAARWAAGRGRPRPAGRSDLEMAVTARVPRSAFRPPAPGEVAVLTVVRSASPHRR